MNKLLLISYIVVVSIVIAVQAKPSEENAKSKGIFQIYICGFKHFKTNQKESEYFVFVNIQINQYKTAIMILFRMYFSVCLFAI